MATYAGNLTTAIARSVEAGRLHAPGRVIDFRSTDALCLGSWDLDFVERVVGGILDSLFTVSPAEAPIHVVLEKGSERVFIELAADGEGLSETRLQELFDATPPVSGPSQDVPPHTFAEARALVEGRGGRLWAMSELGRTRFTVELPRALRPPLYAVKARTEAWRAHATHGEPGRDDARQAPRWARHVRDARIRSLLALWLTLDPTEVLPHPESLDEARISAWRHEMSFARMTRANDDAVLTLVDVGGELERRLGTVLSGTRYLMSATLDSPFIDEFVRRYALAIATGAPQYDYANYALDASGTGRMERLILPFSREATLGVTDLVALVRYIDLPTAAPRALTSLESRHDADH